MLTHNTKRATHTHTHIHTFIFRRFPSFICQQQTSLFLLTHVVVVFILCAPVFMHIRPVCVIVSLLFSPVLRLTHAPRERERRKTHARTQRERVFVSLALSSFSEGPAMYMYVSCFPLDVLVAQVLSFSRVVILLRYCQSSCCHAILISFCLFPLPLLIPTFDSSFFSFSAV